MKKLMVWFWPVILLFIFICPAMSQEASKAKEAPRISKEELRSMLGKPDLVIVDVRVGGEWKDSDKKIKGAVREDPQQLGSWIKKYAKDRTLVFYCS
jgi:hypothetical protein